MPPPDPDHPAFTHDSMFSKPLPRTGHPLGALAHAWLLINCMFGTAALLGAAGLAGTYLCWKLVAGRHPPPTIHDAAGFVCMVLGLMLGLFVFHWIVHRLGRHGISLVLLTMTLIPFIGPVLGILLGLWTLLERWRDRSRPAPNQRPETP